MPNIFSEVAADAIAAVFMVDRVSVHPSPLNSRGTVNADFTTTYTPESPRLTNVRAHIEPMAGRRQNEDGGAETFTELVSVKVDRHTGEDVGPGDIVVVNESNDPALEGLSLAVIRVETRSGGLSCRLVCERPRARSGPGTP